MASKPKNIISLRQLVQKPPHFLRLLTFVIIVLATSIAKSEDNQVKKPISLGRLACGIKKGAGVLLVALPTGQQQINAVKTRNLTALAQTLETKYTKSINDIKYAFSKQYNYGTYYFYNSDRRQQIADRNYFGNLSDANGNPVSEDICAAIAADTNRTAILNHKLADNYRVHHFYLMLAKDLSKAKLNNGVSTGKIRAHTFRVTLSPWQNANEMLTIKNLNVWLVKKCNAHSELLKEID